MVELNKYRSSVQIQKFLWVSFTRLTLQEKTLLTSDTISSRGQAVVREVNSYNT